MPEAAPVEKTYIAVVQEISDGSASLIGPLPQVHEGQIIEVHIAGHYPRKARIVSYFPGGYRLDFTERIHGARPPPSAVKGAVTLARTVVRIEPETS